MDGEATVRGRGHEPDDPVTRRGKARLLCMFLPSSTNMIRRRANGPSDSEMLCRGTVTEPVDDRDAPQLSFDFDMRSPDPDPLQFSAPSSSSSISEIVSSHGSGEEAHRAHGALPVGSTTLEKATCSSDQPHPGQDSCITRYPSTRAPLTGPSSSSNPPVITSYSYLI